MLGQRMDEQGGGSAAVQRARVPRPQRQVGGPERVAILDKNRLGCHRRQTLAPGECTVSEISLRSGGVWTRRGPVRRQPSTSSTRQAGGRAQPRPVTRQTIKDLSERCTSASLANQADRLATGSRSPNEGHSRPADKGGYAPDWERYASR